MPSARLALAMAVCTSKLILRETMDVNSSTCKIESCLNPVECLGGNEKKILDAEFYFKQRS